jgi:hypothetical protein
MKCSLRRCWLGVRGSPRMPWENVHVRLCNAAGTPCKKCNPSDLANPPGRRRARGSNSMNGWRHKRSGANGENLRTESNSQRPHRRRSREVVNSHSIESGV